MNLILRIINEYKENIKDEGFPRYASLTTQELLSSISKALDTSDFQFDSADAPEISSFEFNSGEFAVEDVKENEIESNLEDQTTKAINMYMAKRCANILIRQSHVLYFLIKVYKLVLLNKFILLMDNIV